MPANNGSSGRGGVCRRATGAVALGLVGVSIGVGGLFSPSAVLRAQTTGNIATDQIAEAGATTIPVSVSGSGPSTPFEQLVCAPGASWMRLRFIQLVLEGTDSVELTGTRGGRYVFQGNNWANRTFFTRAFTGECVAVRTSFTQAGSRFTINAHQSGATALASTPMVTAGAGDICDSGLACSGTAALISSMNPAPSVVFAVGDNQYEDGLLAEFTRDYNRYWGAFKSITRPSAGNHEYQSGNAGAGYYDYFNGVGQANGPAGPRGQGYYSYDVGEWHVVVLNTANSGVVPYGAGSAQEQWLRRDLAANTKACTMAQWHHPRFSRGNYRPGIAATQPLWQALQDYRADVVVSGHDHNYQRYAPQTATGVASPTGMRLFVVGTGGRARYAFTGTQPNFENGHDNINGVLRFALSANSYSWQFVPVPGSPVFTDSGSRACNNAPSFDVSVSPSSMNLPRSGTATATVSVANGAGSQTTLSIAGLPAGVTASFSPNPVTPAAGGTATSTLTLAASATAVTGSASLTLTGVAGSLTDTATLALIVPDATPPAAPTGLTAAAGPAQVTLTWTANAEPDLANYRVKRSSAVNGTYQIVSTVARTTTSHADTGLVNGVPYFYVVTAVDTSGNESASAGPVSATPRDTVAPAPPTSLTAGAGNAQVVLDWANNSESDLANYRVKRATSAAGPFSVIATVATSAYTNTGLVNGTAYFYVVSAVDVTGNESANTGPVSATPTAESLLIESLALGDKIDVKLGQSGTQSFTPPGAEAFFVSRVVLNVSRDFEAPTGTLEVSIGAGVNSVGLSSSASITPSAIANTSGGASFQPVTVTFNPPVGPLTPDRIYYLNFSTNAPNGKAYYLQYSGLSVYPGGTYFKNGSNDSKDIRFQIWGAVMSGTSDPPPAAPAGLTATAANGQVSLDWANNTEADLASYHVRRSLVSGGRYTLVATVAAPVSAYTQTGLTNDTRYFYVVSAVDAAGNESANSPEVSATPGVDVLLEESLAIGDKMDVKLGQSGAQSFARTVAGSYYVTRLVLYLSREFEAPNGPLTVSLGSSPNGAALPGSTLSLSPAQVTNNTAGASFQTVVLSFPTPVGPLAPNTAYYLNLSTAASNGKAYYVQYAGASVYPRGTYFKSGSNDGKDARFQIHGRTAP
jgi:fibronectin type 3 domain-containing protein